MDLIRAPQPQRKLAQLYVTSLGNAEASSEDAPTSLPVCTCYTRVSEVEAILLIYNPQLFSCVLSCHHEPLSCILALK